MNLGQVGGWAACWQWWRHTTGRPWMVKSEGWMRGNLRQGRGGGRETNMKKRWRGNEGEEKEGRKTTKRGKRKIKIMRKIGQGGLDSDERRTRRRKQGQTRWKGGQRRERQKELLSPERKKKRKEVTGTDDAASRTSQDLFKREDKKWWHYEHISRETNVKRVHCKLSTL